MKKKILITGGTGFIGYHLAKKCVQMGWEVTSFSKRKPKPIRRLDKVKYLIGDLTKRPHLPIINFLDPSSDGTGKSIINSSGRRSGWEPGRLMIISYDHRLI